MNRSRDSGLKYPDCAPILILTANTFIIAIQPLHNNGFTFGNHTVNGGYSISIISIGTGFEKLKSSNGFRSVYFERFKSYRQTISHRLYNERLNSSGSDYQGSIQQTIEPGYTDGYGSTSPEVIIPAFLAAYTKKDPMKVTLETFPGFK